jgi:hypothetical protein
VRYDDDVHRHSLTAKVPDRPPPAFSTAIATLLAGLIGVPRSSPIAIVHVPRHLPGAIRLALKYDQILPLIVDRIPTGWGRRVQLVGTAIERPRTGDLDLIGNELKVLWLELTEECGEIIAYSRSPNYCGVIWIEDDCVLTVEVSDVSRIGGHPRLDVLSPNCVNGRSCVDIVLIDVWRPAIASATAADACKGSKCQEHQGMYFHQSGSLSNVFVPGGN